MRDIDNGRYNFIWKNDHDIYITLLYCSVYLVLNMFYFFISSQLNEFDGGKKKNRTADIILFMCCKFVYMVLNYCNV